MITGLIPTFNRLHAGFTRWRRPPPSPPDVLDLMENENRVCLDRCRVCWMSRLSLAWSIWGS